METLSHPYDDRSPMLTAFIGLILAYVIVAAVMLGTATQNQRLARAHLAQSAQITHSI
jgi:hypothetical protein